MADEPINIQVTDGIDPNVDKKLQSIASSADKGANSINALKAALSNLRNPDLDALKGQVDNVTQSIKNDLAATNDLAKAQQADNVQVTSLANAYKQLRGNADDATAAIKRAKAAAAQSVPTTSTIINTGGVQLGAAGLARVAQPDQQAVTDAARATAADGAAAMAALGTSAGGAARDINAVENAIEDVGTKGTSWFSKLKEGAASFFASFAGTNAGAIKTLANDAEAAAPKLESLAAHSLNSSTALRELLVLAREGGRGDFTRMAGSASILAGALGLLVPALVAAAAGFTALYAVRSSFNTDSEQADLKAYADTLGLTEKEMRKLDDTTLDSSGHLKEHNDLVVTYGDTLKGLWDTIKDGVSRIDGLSDGWKSFTDKFKTGIDLVGNLLLGFYASIIAGAKILDDFGDSAQAALEGRWSDAHGFIDQMKSDTVNYADNVKTVFNSTKAGINDFYNYWRQKSDQEAKSRIKGEADAIIGNRNPRTSNKKTQDDYLNDENQKLDDQIKLYGQLGEAREVQQQLNQVEEQFAKRRMPLDQAQIDALTQKITLAVHLNAVQTQMNAIYAATVQPQETYNNQLQALNDLLDKGTINQEQYNTEFNKFTDQLRQATDPLAKMTDQFRDEQTQLFKYGDALDQVNNKLKVMNTLKAAGKVNGAGNFASDKDKSDAQNMIDALNNQDQQKYISKQVGDVVNPIEENKKYLDNYKSFVDEVNQLEQNQTLNHQQALQARAALDEKYNQIRFQGTESALDEISTLTQSKNKELAAIGKAAAIVNATIKGYEAVQNAYAQVPYPFNIAAAALVAVATGVQVANIASQSTNVGSYWDGGSFVVHGKTGVDANRISMNVSDGEKVTVQTQAQQQAEKDNQNNGGTGVTHVANYFDEDSFLAALDSKKGDRIIMNAITRQKKTVGNVLGVGK